MAKSPENQSIEILMNAFYAQNQRELESLEKTSESVTKFIGTFMKFMEEQKISSAKFNATLAKLEEQKRTQFETKGRKNPTQQSLDRDIRKILKEEFQNFRTSGQGTLKYESTSDLAKLAFAPLKETAPILEKVNAGLKNTEANFKKLDEGLRKVQDSIDKFTDSLGSGSKVMNTLPAVVQGGMGSGSPNRDADSLGSKTSKAAAGPNKQLPIPVGSNLPAPINQAAETAQGNRVPNSINNLGNKLLGFFSGKSFWGKMLDTIVGGLIASKLLQNTFWDAIKLGFYMIVSTLRRIFGKGPGAAIGLIGGALLGGAAMKGGWRAAGALLRGKGVGTALGAFGGALVPKWVKSLFGKGGTKLASTGVTAAGGLAQLTAKEIPLLEDKLGKKGISKFLGMAHGPATKIAGKEAAKETAKVVGKGAAKVAGKKIPFGVGALIGAGLGVGKIAKGDFLGGAGEIASGLASIIPGVGTAASLGIDAWLMKRDYDISKGKKVAGIGKPLGSTIKKIGAGVGVAATGALAGLGKRFGKIGKVIGTIVRSVGRLGKNFVGLASNVLKATRQFGLFSKKLGIAIAALSVIGLFTKGLFSGGRAEAADIVTEGVTDRQSTGSKILDTAQSTVPSTQVKPSTSTNKNLSQIAIATLETSENVKKILEHFREESKSGEGGGFWTGLRSGVSNLKTDIQNRLSEGKEVAYGTESDLESGGVFGHRVSGTFGEQRTGYKHGGIDLAYSHGEKIYAELGGKVLSAGNLGAYGKAVVVERPDAFMIYGHLSGIPKNIKPGTNLSRGAILGYAGSTGRSSGTHLHLEVRKKDEKRGYSKFGTREHEGRIVSEGGFAVEPQSYIKENMTAEMSIPEAGRKEIAKDLQAQGIAKTKEEAEAAAQQVTNGQAERYLENKRAQVSAPGRGTQYNENDLLKTNLSSGSGSTELYMNMITGRNMFNQN